MVGSDGERMLGITLPHVQAWNAWFAWFDNSVDRYRSFAIGSTKPARRPVATRPRWSARPPCSSPSRMRSAVRRGTDRSRRDPCRANRPLWRRAREFAAEGVSHVQLVLDPITADAIARLEPALALLDA